MNEKMYWKGVVKLIIPFVFTMVLIMPIFQSCQKDGLVDPGNATLKSTVAPAITLLYPESAVNAGEDFNITYSSSCGKILLEKGYLLEYDPLLAVYTKVYTGLTCETQNLLWESVGENVFISCAGLTVTQNLETPGTYVYRAKVNKKAIKNSGCPDCDAATGNIYECVTITVVEPVNTFTDARDGRVYKIVTIGNQTWMAENLAFETQYGSYAYGNNANNVAIYGRLYTWNAAQSAAPPGWHLATNSEWYTLINYLTVNGYGYGGSGDDVGKALASTSGWEATSWPGYVGTDQVTNNSSGFNALPAGSYKGGWYDELGRFANFWTATQYSESIGISRQLGCYYDGVYNYNDYKDYGYSVRCVKD